MKKRLVFIVLAGFSSFASAQSSFREVRDRIYEKPLAELPSYSRFSLKDAFKSVVHFKTALMERAEWTVVHPVDLMEPLPKVLHPMGVCAEAKWQIDTPTVATGLFANGTDVPAIARLSIANNQVTYDPKARRVIAIAVKLFPTTNPEEKVITRNILTADQTGLDGSNRHSFFFGEKPGEVYFSNAAPGTGFAAKLGFILFNRVDGPSDYRPLYQVGEVDARNRAVETAISPTEIRFVPRFGQRTPVPADFREEIRSYEAGELVFDIVLPPQPGVAETKRIGRLTLGKPVVSKECDQELHFHHHPMNRKLDGTQTPAPDLQMDGRERSQAFRYRNAPAKESSVNGWEYKISEKRENPLFHEVKYFNFSGDEMSGALTYMVMSPKLNPMLTLTANFSAHGKTTVTRKTYDLSCVDALPDEATAKFCGEGEIEVLGPGKLRTTMAKGPVKWDLVYEAAENERTGDITQIKLDHTLPLKLEKVIWPLKGQFNWVPTFRAARVSGWVSLGDGAPVKISSEAGYHDQHWGIWNPSYRPMRWAHFASRDSKGSAVELMMGEFPGNADAKAGLSLHVDGKKTSWAPGQYKVETLENGRATVAIPGSNDLVVATPIDPSFQTGKHAIRKRLRITTLGAPYLTAELETLAFAGAGSASSQFVLDEQMMSFKAEFDAGGERRPARGPGFYIETSSTKTDAK